LTRKAWILGTLALAVGLAALLDVYFVSEVSGATLLWNSDKAVLFLQGGRLGYRASYLQYLVEPLLEWLHYVPLPDEKTDFVFVVEITPAAVHRYEFENTGFSLRGPMGQFIYGGTDRGQVKWTGTRFEPSTAEELQRLGRINFPSNYDNLNGWCGRWDLPDGKTVIELGGKQVTLIRSGLWYKEISVDLSRPGHAPERIWYMNFEPHRVSKGKYYSVFVK
jgi:hypothetical protein